MVRKVFGEEVAATVLAVDLPRESRQVRRMDDVLDAQFVGDALLPPGLLDRRERSHDLRRGDPMVLRLVTSVRFQRGDVQELAGGGDEDGVDRRGSRGFC